jgi:hypothetical protein
MDEFVRIRMVRHKYPPPPGLESNTQKRNTLFFKVFLPFGFCYLLALPTYHGKDIVFRFIIEYSSLRDFYRPLGNK